MKLQDLFAAPNSWTQGAFARDNNGLPVRSQHPDAACWCLSGGIGKCYNNRSIRAMKIKNKIYKYIAPFRNIPQWNDAEGRTIKDVRKLVKDLNL